MVAAFGVGNSTQISTAVTSVNEALLFLGFTPSFRGNLMMGLLAGGLVALVVLGVQNGLEPWQSISSL